MYRLDREVLAIPKPQYVVDKTAGTTRPKGSDGVAVTTPRREPRRTAEPTKMQETDLTEACGMRLGEMTGEERRPLVFEAEEPSLPSATPLTQRCANHLGRGVHSTQAELSTAPAASCAQPNFFGASQGEDAWIDVAS
jgi:hypothetical protein